MLKVRGRLHVPRRRCPLLRTMGRTGSREIFMEPRTPLQVALCLLCSPHVRGIRLGKCYGDFEDRLIL